MSNRSEKLHLGCGLNTPADWLNVDGSWNAKVAKYPLIKRIIRRVGLIPVEQFEIPWNSEIFIHDVRSPLPFQDGGFRYIYASHLLEHLYWEEGQRLIRECLRVLKPGGCLRMVVPDLRAIIEEYNHRDSVENASVKKADRFNDRMLLRARRPPSGNFLYRIYSLLNDFHSHKWMYDADSLTKCLQDAGFIDVQEMAFCDSRISSIEDIEVPERVLDGAGICVEGVRPEIV